MATTISSSFVITVDETIDDGNTLTITNPGRTMQIVDITVEGDGSALATFSRGEPGGLGVAFATASPSWAALSGVAPGKVQLALSKLNSSTSEIRIAAAGGDITKVVLYCIGNPAQELTTSEA